MARGQRHWERPETTRHAGHADIVRELVDGAVGHRDGTDDMGDLDAAGRTGPHARIAQAAGMPGAGAFRSTPRG